MLAPPPKPPPRPRFVPDGWLWVVEAINVVGRHAHGDAWTGKERTAWRLPLLPSNSDEELRLLKRWKQRTWRKGQKLKFTVAELRIEYEQEYGALLRYQDAMRQLQQWLYASQVAAQILKKNGDKEPIPPRVWGKDDALAVLRSGKVEFSVGRAYYGGDPATIEGTVLISKDELDRALEGGSARATDVEALGSDDGNGVQPEVKTDFAPEQGDVAPAAETIVPASKPNAADLGAREREREVAAKHPGGRPPKYVIAEFNGELLRLAKTTDGLPNRPILFRHMADWCSETWDEIPADSTIRLWISSFRPPNKN